MFAKKVVFAAVLAAPLAFLASPASADDVDLRVGIGIGTPRYYGYGAYPDVYYPYYRRKLSCWQARELVRDRGFNRVRTIECFGRVYTFRALRRGKPVTINVNARTGAIWRV
jgi:hypothetical protein